MDPRGNIYKDDEDKIPAEDTARLEGYLHARAEADEAKRAEVLALTHAGPGKARDEAAIRHKIYSAVTEADDLLRMLLRPDLLTSADGPLFRSEIRRVRGLLAEWRLESD